MQIQKIVLTLLGIVGILSPTQARDFYVAPNGNDTGSGLRGQPLGTLETARDAVRKSTSGPHRIILLPGDYFLSKPFELDARDNGLTVESLETGKAILYGGKLIVGWRRDGGNFWCADLPGVKEGHWDFRSLVVDGRMAVPARIPESGTLEHQSRFDVQWLSSVGGGWARTPTLEEFVTLRYDPKDIPETLDAHNAEVRIYHMWDESRVGVITNDRAHHLMIIQKPSKPPGSFGIMKYVVFNTREGMTKPGQWYLDRTAGKVVYWPLPGEDMTKARVVGPVLERIISLNGTSQAPVKQVTVRGLNLQATSTPLKPGGSGIRAFDGAFHIEQAQQCVLENLEIANVSGQGILASAIKGCKIQSCQIHDTGCCAIRVSGVDTLIAENHLYNVGLIYPSAVALEAGGDTGSADDKGFHIYRNEIHDTSYGGIDCFGSNYLVEENLVYRVMREMSDGGAIYGMTTHSRYRGNYVRDVVKTVEGYGVSSFYLDEGSEDCVVEHNVSDGVERPTQIHISRNITINDNVFIAKTNMELSFQRSSDCTFVRNTLFVPGVIKLVRSPAVTLWTNNIIYRNGVNKVGATPAFTIENAMPVMPPPERRTLPYNVSQVSRPPHLDGEFSPNEWPDRVFSVAREASRWEAGGVPAFATLAYDDQCLYVAVKVILFDVATLRQGSIWGQDDGVEVSIAGDQGTFVIRGFPNGTTQSITNGGISAQAAFDYGKRVRFAAKAYGKVRGDWHSGWRCEWAIPFSILGIKPANGLKVPFNIGTYRAEDGGWRCLEGTLGDNWTLDQAATLQLK